jgi:hypothetical protein
VNTDPCAYCDFIGPFVYDEQPVRELHRSWHELVRTCTRAFAPLVAVFGDPGPDLQKVLQVHAQYGVPYTDTIAAARQELEAQGYNQVQVSTDHGGHVVLVGSVDNPRTHAADDVQTGGLGDRIRALADEVVYMHTGDGVVYRPRIDALAAQADELDAKAIANGRAAAEKARELVDLRSNPRDGYHTMAELYEYRMLYNAHAAAGWLAAGHYVVKSWRHSDGELCFGGGWFVVVATLPTGQVTNHYEAQHWDLFDVPEPLSLPPAYDGNTPAEAAERLRAALNPQVPR